MPHHARWTVMPVLVVAGLGLSLTKPATAEVQVQRGPTPLINGDAIAANDLTLRNEHLIVSLGVDTAPPWGVAPGGIIDAAPTRSGERAPSDVMSLFDLIPDNWSDWPTTYQKFTVVEDGPERGVIRVERDWRAVELDTTYTLEAGSDRIHVVTEMHHTGDEPMEGLLSGYALWSDGGAIFSVPGLDGLEEGPAEGALADWMAMYDETWSMGMHAPYFDTVAYDSRDMYLEHDLAPGETRRFEGWLQIRPDGDLAPIARAAAERRGEPTGTLAGEARTLDGSAVEEPWIVVEREGETLFWARGEAGEFRFPAPAGDYDVYATAAGHARGAPQQVSVAPDGETSLTFDDLERPGRVRFAVTEASTGGGLDARIEILEGQTPVIDFLGQSTFFTELEPVGVREARVAPGDYRFEISHAKGFRSTPVEASVSVSSGETADVAADIARTVRPGEHGWYMADMHHHSDILDGFTPPEWVVRSQLAEGLDIVHLSDHDALGNLAATNRFAEQRGVPFIPGLEFSPSWGHFITAPIDWGQEIGIEVGTATAQEIFAEARRMGAEMISAAHPRNNYGYFTSLERGVVPGGFTAEYDLIELNSATFPDKAIEDAYAYWDRGWDYYLAGGSDVHDVWNDSRSDSRSGRMRTVARLDGEPGMEPFIEAVLAGRAYATTGPVVYPDTLFGSTVNVTEGERAELGFTLRAVNGLAAVRLIGRGGEVVAEQTFSGEPTRADVAFTPTPQENGWYALVVEDTTENRAYTNPIWVNVVSADHR